MTQVLNAYLLAAGGGGGGSTPTRFNYLGATSGENLDRATAANTLYLTKITTTAAVNPTLRNLFVRQRASTASGIHLQGAVYSDSAGSPGTLLFSGNVVTTATVSYDTDIALTFASPPALAASTSYWVGYFADGAFKADGNSATSALKSVAATYGSGLPASPTGFGTTANGICCYTSIGDETAVSGTGFISQLNAATGGTTGRWSIPADRAPGDIAFIHVDNINSSGSPTWSGSTWPTLIDNQPKATFTSYPSLLYWRRIDGTESILDLQETVSIGNHIQVAISIWRGYKATGTPYEAYATLGGNSGSPAGTAITTLGANRTVMNFYSNTNSNASSPPGGGGANGWADAYALFTTAGFDGSVTCSWKDIATASLVPVESGRTLGGGGEWWRTFTLALIKV